MEGLAQNLACHMPMPQYLTLNKIIYNILDNKPMSPDNNLRIVSSKI